MTPKPQFRKAHFFQALSRQAGAGVPGWLENCQKARFMKACLTEQTHLRTAMTEDAKPMSRVEEHVDVFGDESIADLVANHRVLVQVKKRRSILDGGYKGRRCREGAQEKDMALVHKGQRYPYVATPT